MWLCSLQWGSICVSRSWATNEASYIANLCPMHVLLLWIKTVLTQYSCVSRTTAEGCFCSHSHIVCIVKKATKVSHFFPVTKKCLQESKNGRLKGSAILSVAYLTEKPINLPSVIRHGVSSMQVLTFLQVIHIFSATTANLTLLHPDQQQENQKICGSCKLEKTIKGNIITYAILPLVIFMV